jgi:hypothetical protein
VGYVRGSKKKESDKILPIQGKKRGSETTIRSKESR